MPVTTAQKLKLKEGSVLLTVHAPKSFRQDLGELPAGVRLSDNAKTFNQIHWFLKDKAQLDEEVEGIVALLKDGITCWIYFPKGSSKIQTDLTRDHGWESLLQHQHLQRLSLVSFNDTWSAFAVRRQLAADQTKKEAPKERPVAAYVDATKKLVFLPDDFATALNDKPVEKAFFEALSFTNKKEYVDWIVSAKRAETRQTRVAEAVSRLAKGWKNPANR